MKPIRHIGGRELLVLGITLLHGWLRGGQLAAFKRIQLLGAERYGLFLRLPGGSFPAGLAHPFRDLGRLFGLRARLRLPWLLARFGFRHWRLVLRVRLEGHLEIGRLGVGSRFDLVQPRRQSRRWFFFGLSLLFGVQSKCSGPLAVGGFTRGQRLTGLPRETFDANGVGLDPSRLGHGSLDVRHIRIELRQASVIRSSLLALFLLLEYGGHNPYGLLAVRQLLENSTADLSSLQPVVRLPIHLSEKHLQIGPIRILLER